MANGEASLTIFHFKFCLYYIYLGSWCLKVRKQLPGVRFFPSTLSVPGMELTSSSLAPRAFTWRAILPPLPASFSVLPSHSLQPFSFLSFRPFSQQALVPFMMGSSLVPAPPWVLQKSLEFLWNETGGLQPSLWPGFPTPSEQGGTMGRLPPQCTAWARSWGTVITGHWQLLRTWLSLSPPVSFVPGDKTWLDFSVFSGK